MNFLVIGGAGYVGSHFVYEAVRQNHTCLVYDNLSEGHKWAVEGKADLVEADIHNTEKLKSTILDFKPDAIFHYAANALVGESVTNPEKYYQNNVMGTKNILDVIRSVDPKIPFVFSSTCAVFGTPKELPIHEELEKNPQSPYGRSKLACEFVIEDYCEAYGMSAMALRYFNACGADESGEIGEAHNEETHLIPNILIRAIKGEGFKIFGDDYPTKDGTCVRDYIHVTDLAIAHIDAVHFLKKKKSGFTTALLGSGEGFSNLEIMKSIEKVIDKKIDYKIEERRPGDPAELVANNQKAKELLDFSLKHSSLENIIKTAWVWHNK